MAGIFYPVHRYLFLYYSLLTVKNKTESGHRCHQAHKCYDETIFCAPGLTHFFFAYAWGGLNTKTPEVCPLQKGEGISECRKLAVSFLESVVYRHNFQVLI